MEEDFLNESIKEVPLSTLWESLYFMANTLYAKKLQECKSLKSVILLQYCIAEASTIKPISDCLDSLKDPRNKQNLFAKQYYQFLL